MKKLLAGFVSLLAASGVAVGQEESSAAGRTNASAAFEQTSAARVNLLGTGEESNGSFAVAEAAPGEAAAAPAAAAKPRFVFGNRDDYRWQLGVGVEYMRFLSSRFDSNLVGLNTTVTYFTNGWFAITRPFLPT